MNHSSEIVHSICPMCKSEKDYSFQEADVTLVNPVTGKLEIEKTKLIKSTPVPCNACNSTGIMKSWSERNI